MVDLATSFVQAKLATFAPTPPSPSPSVCPASPFHSSPPASPPTFSPAIDPDVSTTPPTIYDIAGQVPDLVLCESHLANIALRVCRDQPTSKAWQGVEDVASVRFLLALKWLADIFSDVRSFHPLFPPPPST